MQPNQQNSWKILILACTTFVLYLGSTVYAANHNATGPAPTISAPNAATLPRTPFQFRATPAFQNTSFTISATFNVPKNQRLVIENISAHISIPLGQELSGGLQVSTVVNEVQGFHFIFVPETGASGDFDDFNGGQQVRIYADPGTTVNIIAGKNDFTCPNNLCGTLDVTISGYLLSPNSPDIGP